MTIKTLFIRGALLSGALLSLTLTSRAESVLLEENFDGDYSRTFPTVYDGDSQMPSPSIQAFFLSAQHQMYMPWWPLRESASAADRFMSSHSYYYPAGTSDDWLISAPLTIPSTGYVLEFDAQSVCVRSDNRLSDLHIFIDEQMRTADYRPTEAAAVLKQIPAGATPDVTTDEWEHYTVDLDAYAGKTVYIMFANLNTDRDILSIDNVKVYMPEAAEVWLSPMPEYITGETVDMRVHIKVSEREALTGITVEFSQGTAYPVGRLEAGEEYYIDQTFYIDEPASTQWLGARVLADGYGKSVGANVTRLGFETTRRVLLEETTGLWCSNCPLGMYNIESLVNDDEYGDYVVPVSVHINGNATDIMAMDDYADYLGLAGVAPLVRINRYNAYAGFSGYDFAYDPENENTFGHRVAKETRNPALMDISLEAEWVVEGADTLGIRATATVMPALNFDEPERYRVGFVLTENNVGLNNNPFWIQENGVSGYPYPSKLGGWTELPGKVPNLRYHYVARATSAYSGLKDSFSELKNGGSYRVDYTMDIPDTYQERQGIGMVAAAVNTQFCELTAYIVDTEDLHIVNCVRVPMSEHARELYTVEDLLRDLSGVEGVSADGGEPERWYDVQGRQVASPTAPGLYISSRGGKRLVR